MAELDKNLNDAIELAATTGDKVVTVECPCCHKIFYTTKTKAAYALVNRAPEDFDFDRTKISLKQLGEKCPHCGFVAELGTSELFGIDRDPEQKAEDIREVSQSSWAEICNPGINFKEVKKDD